MLQHSSIAAGPVEVSGGVVFSISAPQAYASWPSNLPVSMGGAEWNRLIQLHYSPFVVLKNTASRPVILASIPTVTFKQPPIGFKFKRIASTMSGDITALRVAADQMYVDPLYSGNKTYSMTLYQQIVNGTGSGKLGLEPGQALIMTPAFSSLVKVSDRFDWRNNLTSALKAAPGWLGCGNGFSIDWLAGTSATTSNGGLKVVASRSTDVWDVECGYSGATAGWRVFKLQEDGSPIPTPDPSSEVTTFPFNLSDIQGTVSASSMTVNMNQTAVTQPIHAMFSMLGPPTSATTLDVVSDSDNNGLSDVWEMQYFNQLGVPLTEDADGDGLNNRFEFVSGHSPIDSGDRFAQELAKQASGNLQLTWTSIPGRSYVIQQSIDLQSWTQLRVAVGAVAPATTTSVDLGAPDSNPKHFRIKMTATP